MVFEQLLSYLPVNQFIKAGILFFVLAVILRIGLLIVERALLFVTRKTTTDIDDILIKRTSKSLTFIAILVSLLIALNELVLSENLEFFVFRTTYSLLAIFTGYLIFVVVDNSLIPVWKQLSKKTKSDIDDTIGTLVHEVLRFTIIITTFLLILSIWGINIVPLLGALGIAGLAVALALQPVLSNIFSGVAIVIDGTFKVGDIIKVNDYMGEVFKIGLRTTRIKTFDNEMIIMPNSVIANSNVQNFFQPDKTIRVNFDFGVEYGVDPEYVKKIVIEEIEKIKTRKKDEEIRVLFLEMADNSINFKIMFWVDDISKKWPAHQEAITRIYRRLYKEKIGIPYPQRTVWLRDEGKAKSPDPEDKKFRSVKGKYFSAFGHEYKESKEKKKESKKKKRKGILDRFKKFGFKR